MWTGEALCIQVLEGVHYVNTRHQNRQQRHHLQLLGEGASPGDTPAPTLLLGLGGCNWARRMGVLLQLVKFFLGFAR